MPIRCERETRPELKFRKCAKCRNGRKCRARARKKIAQIDFVSRARIAAIRGEDPRNSRFALRRARAFMVINCDVEGERFVRATVARSPQTRASNRITRNSNYRNSQLNRLLVGRRDELPEDRASARETKRGNRTAIEAVFVAAKVHRHQTHQAKTVVLVLQRAAAKQSFALLPLR